MGHVQLIAIILIVSGVTMIVHTDAKPQSSRNTFSSSSSDNNGFSWTQTDTETFNREFESHEKTVKNIAGMIIGIVIGVFVLIILGLIACCCIPACMCARGAGSNRGAVIHLPPAPADRSVTQPLYPIQGQGQGGAYPAQPAYAVPYGQPVQYPVPHQTVPNMAQPPPYPAAGDFSSTAQNKQAPYNPYYQDGGGNPPNSRMTTPPYPPN